MTQINSTPSTGAYGQTPEGANTSAETEVPQEAFDEMFGMAMMTASSIMGQIMSQTQEAFERAKDDT